MTEERITQVGAPGQATHTHTTVITDPPRRGGGATLLVVLALLVLAVLGFMFLGPMSGAEIAKDNAVAEAAGSVGAAAEEVGAAAEEAADRLAR